MPSPHPPPLPLPGPVLLAGHDAERLPAIGAALIRQGVVVTMAVTPDHAPAAALMAGAVALALDLGAAPPQAWPAITRLSAAAPWLPLIVLTTGTRAGLTRALLRAGADACLDLAADPRCLELGARLQGLHRRGALAGPGARRSAPRGRTARALVSA